MLFGVREASPPPGNFLPAPVRLTHQRRGARCQDSKPSCAKELCKTLGTILGEKGRAIKGRTPLSLGLATSMVANIVAPVAVGPRLHLSGPGRSTLRPILERVNELSKDTIELTADSHKILSRSQYLPHSR